MFDSGPATPLAGPVAWDNPDTVPLRGSLACAVCDNALVDGDFTVALLRSEIAADLTQRHSDTQTRYDERVSHGWRPIIPRGDQAGGHTVNTLVLKIRGELCCGLCNKPIGRGTTTVRQIADNVSKHLDYRHIVPTTNVVALAS